MRIVLAPTKQQTYKGLDHEKERVVQDFDVADVGLPEVVRSRGSGRPLLGEMGVEAKVRWRFDDNEPSSWNTWLWWKDDQQLIGFDTPELVDFVEQGVSSSRLVIGYRSKDGGVTHRLGWLVFGGP